MVLLKANLTLVRPLLRGHDKLKTWCKNIFLSFQNIIICSLTCFSCTKIMYFWHRMVFVMNTMFLVLVNAEEYHKFYDLDGLESCTKHFVVFYPYPENLDNTELKTSDRGSGKFHKDFIETNLKMYDLNYGGLVTTDSDWETFGNKDLDSEEFDKDNLNREHLNNIGSDPEGTYIYAFRTIK